MVEFVLDGPYLVASEVLSDKEEGEKVTTSNMMTGGILPWSSCYLWPPHSFFSLELVAN